MQNRNPPVLATQFDIIIIGGGPAGSTAASLLAEKGWSVCVLEKDIHPRFHIGESLLPMNLPIFERLGVLNEVRQIGIVKNAAEFNASDTLRPIDTFYFRESLADNPPFAFQILRADLDHLLLNNSRKKGVTVIEGITVSRVDLHSKPRCVYAADSQGSPRHFECRFVIDASGRNTVLATQLNLKRKNPHHNYAAIFCHYENVVRRSGEDAGNISIYWIAHGWIWMIPLHNNMMSIGAVCNSEYMKTRSTSLSNFLWNTLQQVPDIAVRLKNAHPAGETRAAANYSYSSRRVAGNGYVLIGDAYTFVDPVFSSGVFLAMQSGLLASELVDTILRNPKAADKAVKKFTQKIHASLQSFSWFIYRFNSYAMRHLLMHHPGNNASEHFKTVKAAVISVFSGVNQRQKTLLIPLLIFKINFYFLNLIDLRDRIELRIKRKTTIR